MSEPRGLDDRLRAALGDEGPVPLGTGDRNHTARSQVLSGIRHRRTRRLQMAGIASVVALALAVSLPQVLGGAPAHSELGGRSASSGVVHGPSAGPEKTFEKAGADAPVLTATCRVDSGTKESCGRFAAGSGAANLGAKATDAGKPVAFTSNTARAALGTPLVVRPGARLVVDLPGNGGKWRWTAPTITGTPVYHGTGPPVAVRTTTAQAGAQAFLVATRVAVTVVLEAKAHPIRTGPGSSNGRPAAVWVLELEVEGQ